MTPIPAHARRILTSLLALGWLGCTTQDSEELSLSKPLTVNPGRQAELDEWIEKNHRQARRKIVKTERLDDGTTVDWVARESVAGADAVPPPPLAMPQPIPGVRAAVPQKLQGPPGSLPFIRPSFTPYITGSHPAKTVDEYVRHVHEERRKANPASGNPTAGSGDRLYGGDIFQTTNYGLHSLVNNDFSGVDIPYVPEFSIFELASYCRNASNAVTDLVGVTLGRIPSIYGIGYRFGAEWFSGTSNSWVTGGGNTGPWVQVSSTKAPGMAINAQSVIGGTQAETNVAVVLYDSPKRWWVWLINEWIGYFDTSLAFTSLDNNGCFAGWYGEVYDPQHVSFPPWTDADLGSGQLPASGGFSNNWGSRGYSRLQAYNTAISNGGFTSRTGFTAAATVDPSCYNALLTTDGTGAGQSPVVFFGGPGGDGAGCN